MQLQMLLITAACESNQIGLSNHFDWTDATLQSRGRSSARQLPPITSLAPPGLAIQPPLISTLYAHVVTRSERAPVWCGSSEQRVVLAYRSVGAGCHGLRLPFGKHSSRGKRNEGRNYIPHLICNRRLTQLVTPDICVLRAICYRSCIRSTCHRLEQTLSGLYIIKAIDCRLTQHLCIQLERLLRSSNMCFLVYIGLI